MEQNPRHSKLGIHLSLHPETPACPSPLCALLWGLLNCGLRALPALDGPTGMND